MEEASSDTCARMASTNLSLGTVNTECDSQLSDNVGSTGSSDATELQGARNEKEYKAYQETTGVETSESTVIGLGKSSTVVEEEVEMDYTLKDQEESGHLKSVSNERSSNLKPPSCDAIDKANTNLEDASKSLGYISDGVVDIPFNKEDAEDKVESGKSSSLHEETPCESHPQNYADESMSVIASTHTLSDQGAEDNGSDEILHKIVSKEAHHEAATTEMPENVSEGAPDVESQVEDGLIEKSPASRAESPTPPESPPEIQDEPLVTSQKTLINVYITWTDNETGKSTSLKWDHQSCEVCCSNFSDWKQHVVKKHRTSDEQKPKNSSRRKKRIPKLRIPRKLVKIEPPDDTIEPPDDDTSALLNISVPALVSLRSLGEKAHKMEEENLTNSKEKTKSTKLLYVPIKDQSLCLKNDETLEVVGPKKPGRPKKVINQDDTVVVPIKRKRGRHKIESDDEEDPEYVPAGHKRLRPKRPIEYRPSKLFACSKEDCGMMFDKWRDCKDHEHNVHGDKMFRCNFEGCRKMFKTRSRKDKHESTHVAQIKRKEEGYKCDYCEMIFKNVKDRAFHSKTHVSFKCGFEGCERTYTSLKEMHRHKKLHNAERVFPCPLCPKKFIGPKYVNRHLKTHRDRTLKCDQCHKTFKTQQALDRHKRLHTGQGLLVCQFCGKKLNGKSSLDRHERLHRGEKPYKCKFCDMRFVCCNSMQTHMQEHTGYQFVCAQCGHKFKSKGNLLEHERSHTGETPYQCKKCGRTYRTASGLWTHMHARHSDIKRHKCEVCSKAFFTHGALYKHRKVHTGERNSECKYCHKRFGNSSTRAGHIRQVHMGIKRTGHQGKAKRLKEDAVQRRLPQEAKSKLQENPIDLELSPGAKSGNKTNVIGEPKGSNTKVLRIPESKSVSMVPLPMMARKLGSDRGRLAGMHPVPTPGTSSQNPHPHGDPSRSDFYTMVESFIQFSKEH